MDEYDIRSFRRGCSSVYRSHLALVMAQRKTKIASAKHLRPESIPDDIERCDLCSLAGRPAAAASSRTGMKAGERIAQPEPKPKINGKLLMSCLHERAEENIKRNPLRKMKQNERQNEPNESERAIERRIQKIVYDSVETYTHLCASSCSSYDCIVHCNGNHIAFELNWVKELPCNQCTNAEKYRVYELHSHANAADSLHFEMQHFLRRRRSLFDWEFFPCARNETITIGRRQIPSMSLRICMTIKLSGAAGAEPMNALECRRETINSQQQQQRATEFDGIDTMWNEMNPNNLNAFCKA